MKYREPGNVHEIELYYEHTSTNVLQTLYIDV